MNRYLFCRSYSNLSFGNITNPRQPSNLTFLCYMETLSSSNLNLSDTIISDILEGKSKHIIPFPKVDTDCTAFKWRISGITPLSYLNSSHRKYLSLCSPTCYGDLVKINFVLSAYSLHQSWFYLDCE